MQVVAVSAPPFTQLNFGSKIHEGGDPRVQVRLKLATPR